MFSFFSRLFARVGREGGLKTLEGRLVGACFGDCAKAERLVVYENKRAGNINRFKAVQRALDRA